jgi:hypothetical protein
MTGEQRAALEVAIAHAMDALEVAADGDWRGVAHSIKVEGIDSEVDAWTVRGTLQMRGEPTRWPITIAVKYGEITNDR